MLRQKDWDPGANQGMPHVGPVIKESDRYEISSRKVEQVNGDPKEINGCR